MDKQSIRSLIRESRSTIFKISVYCLLIINYQPKAFMTTFTSPGFYSQLQSAYNLDEACMGGSTSQNSQNCNAFTIGKSKQEKRKSKVQAHPKMEMELSFDKDLLKEHLKVMEKYLPIFSRIEEGNKHRKHHISGLNLPPWVNDVTRSDQNYVNAGNEYSEQSWQGLDIYSLIPIQGNQSLRDFLGKCMAKVENSTRSHFLALTKIIWSKCCQAGDFLREVGSIINYSQSILGNLFNETTQLLGLYHLNALQTDEFTHFLQVYFITFVLVAKQYFQNPYFEEETPRSFEEDSDFDFFESMEQGTCKNPRKIVHHM